MAFKASQVKVFANAGPRIEHLDSKGGGFITRTFYCEPYTAYPSAELFLKGTMVSDDGTTWGRVKPHNDPIKPNFFCSDVKVIPFSSETITGMPIAPFTPSTDYSVNPTGSEVGQQLALKGVMDCVDDHSYGSIADFSQSPPLTPAQIAAGGVPYPTDSTSTGKCGAYLVCTYTPLIFLDGLSGSIDPFDYVNPIWEEETLITQTGRSLFFYAPQFTIGFVETGLNVLQGGISDTYGKPEAIWHFTIKRFMVKFLPKLTIGLLNTKINKEDTNIGNLKFPAGTLCFEKMENDLVLGPDGTTWYNITLKFKVRLLYDDFFTGSDDVPASNNYTTGWIDWNHHYGVPTSRVTGIQGPRASYYPTVWNGGVFQLFGNNHPLYVPDSDMISEWGSVGGMGTFLGDISIDLFNNGNRLNQ